MLKHTLDALLRTHITTFEALWDRPQRLPNKLWKWDVRHSMWVERQKVRTDRTAAGEDCVCHQRGMHHQSEALHMCFVECCCDCQQIVLAVPPHSPQGLASNLKHCMGALQCTYSSATQPRRVKHRVRHMRLCTPLSMLQVLAGVTILFSALIPLGQDPKTHNLAQLGEQFGAKCVTQEHPSVTHVVTANSGSAKAQWALANGKHLVSRHWYAKDPLIHLLHAFR